MADSVRIRNQQNQVQNLHYWPSDYFERSKKKLLVVEIVENVAENTNDNRTVIHVIWLGMKSIHNQARGNLNLFILFTRCSIFCFNKNFSHFPVLFYQKKIQSLISIIKRPPDSTEELRICSV